MDFSYTGAMQTFTVSSEGIYVIECWGASGGGPSRTQCGLGAYSKSTYYLHAGDVLKILVAGKGAWDGARGGGGGGSFVELNSATLLCVAGGGGGSVLSRTANNFSHGQAGKYAGNYALNAFLPGLNTAGRSDLAGGSGGGYSGGDSSRDGYANTAGGGSSYFIGTTGVELAKSGYEAMPTITDKTIDMNGNFGDGFVKIDAPAKMVLTDGSLYYIPTTQFLDIRSKEFAELSLDNLLAELDNNTVMPISVAGLNAQMTVNGETLRPSDIIDFSKYKICIINKGNVSKLVTNYTPSSIALSKTVIKVKDKYTPFADNTTNPYLDITATSKSNITYCIDYDNINDITDTDASLLYQEKIKDDFSLSFKLISPSSLLKSATLYNRDLNNYYKIKDDDLDVDNDYFNTWITFEKAYTEVIVNKIVKQYFKYYESTLDTF